MKVKFLPSGEEHEIEFNETILHLAQRTGIHIQSVCKGIPSCAECRVRIVEGEHNVLPPSTKEVALIGTAHYVDLSRLSCQLRCFGDVTVDLTEQVEKEAKAQAKPQERVRSDGQESRAVLGNMFEENQEFLDNDQPEPSSKPKRQQKAKAPKLDKRDDFYGTFFKEEGKGGGKPGKKGGGKNQKSGRNRNRNRNRRRNKGKQQSAGGQK